MSISILATNSWKLCLHEWFLFQSEKLGFEIWGRSLGVWTAVYENERNTKGKWTFCFLFDKCSYNEVIDFNTYHIFMLPSRLITVILNFHPKQG